MSNLIYKALKDENISDEEFSLIIKEVDTFEDLKLGIRRRFRVEEKKCVDMDSLRTEIREDLIKKLIPTAPPDH